MVPEKQEWLGFLLRSGGGLTTRLRIGQALHINEPFQIFPQRSECGTREAARRKKTGASDEAAGDKLTAKAQNSRLTMSIFDKPLTMIVAIVVVVAIVLLLQMVFR
jgi:hypothetical protein